MRPRRNFERYISVDALAEYDRQHAGVQRGDCRSEAMHAYTGTFTFGDSVGYWTADEFVSMLQGLVASGGPLTSAALEKFVNSGSTRTTGRRVT